MPRAHPSVSRGTTSAARRRRASTGACRPFCTIRTRSRLAWTARRCNSFTAGNRNDPHYGISIAPFVDAQGSENFPFKKTDTSNLQGGVDFQLSVFNRLLFDHQYFIATPYYQTDFRGVANIQGFTAAWEPVAPGARLGGYIGVPDPYLDWYWQFRAAADFKNVTTIGATGLRRGEYDWVGATVQAHFLLFPGRANVEPDWVSPGPAALSTASTPTSR